MTTIQFYNSQHDKVLLDITNIPRLLDPYSPKKGAKKAVITRLDKKNGQELSQEFVNASPKQIIPGLIDIVNCAARQIYSQINPEFYKNHINLKDRFLLFIFNIFFSTPSYTKVTRLARKVSEIINKINLEKIKTTFILPRT